MKRSRRTVVVLVIICTLCTIYFVFSPSFRSAILTIHRFQWHVLGSSNYVITIDLISIAVNQGINVITVQDGKVKAVSVSETRWAQHFPLDDYQDLTAEGLFLKVQDCISPAAGMLCSYKYDSIYGYPKYIDLTCSDPQICGYDNGYTITVIGMIMHK